MKSKPNEASPLETECLFGEKVEILDYNRDRVYCRLITDGYCGWVKKSSLGNLKEITHRVLAVRTFVYKEKHTKSDILLYLPLGSKLSIEVIENCWAKLSFSDNNKISYGYIPSAHIVKNEYKVKDWVKIAEKLEGTPYKWGGRDTIGIDCSALLQLSYQTYGEEIPRNTSDQVKVKKKIIKNINELNRGCVVFWKGHVGIMTDRKKCIHANAFHMQTKTEQLSKIIKRLGADFKIIKMMDFN